MDQKLRHFIDSLRVNRHTLTTAGEVADALENLLAAPLETAFTAEQLQVVVNIAVAVGQKVRIECERQTEAKLAELRNELAPHLAQ